MKTIAGAIVVMYGLSLVGFAVLAAVRPDRAGRFLDGFAQSARAHFMEQGLRLAVGIALLLHAPSSRFPMALEGFGWIIAITTVCLLLVPWRWHKRFADRVIPPVKQHVRLFALAAGALGAALLYASTV